MIDRPPLEHSPTGVRRSLGFLIWAERGVFLVTGVLLFAAALALLKESVEILIPMFAGRGSALAHGPAFLDVVLLVLMVVELAYTVMLSLQDAELQAEPFLIVGLIAVIRRMLVITAGENGTAGASVGANANELLVLTGIVLALVASICVLRIRPRREERRETSLRDESRSSSQTGTVREHRTVPPDRTR